MSEAEIRSERERKLKALKEAGMPAYPVICNRTHTIQQALERFQTLSADAQTLTIAGRIMSRRGQGGILFADVFDGSARMQIVLKKDEMPEELFVLFMETADMGDFIEASGSAFVTKRGEQSLRVETWRMLAKAVLPIPSEWFGLKDEELKLRERYLAILLDPELRATVERRARFWQTIRAFYTERGYVEVETPVLETSPGGADARPFRTHHHALDIEMYLRISLELWLKRLLVAGFPKVFEIGRIFRNEGQSREHAQDYTQLESYEAYADMRTGMRLIQDLYRRIAKEVYHRYTFTINGHDIDLAADWPEIDFCETIRAAYGIDPLSCSEEAALAAAARAGIASDEVLNKARAIDYLWKTQRKKISGPAFLTGVPVYLEPLAKRMDSNPDVAERFQVILAGSEMGKGFSELNDPHDQRARFEEQQKLRDAGDDEAQRLDEEFIRSMEYGMPPAFGFGVSERLFAFLENRSIHETQIFPLLRPRS